jgi:hypothetical protein
MSLQNIPVTGVFNIIGSVATYALLPDATLHGNELWKVSTDSGVWPINKQYKGLYLSDGIDWSLVEFTSTSVPDGAASSAKQDTGNTSLSNIDTKTPVLGQGAMSASVPVTIASNQTAIPITGSITATNPSVGTSGSAIPSSSTLTAGSDGTNLRPIKTSSTGVISVDGSAVTQPVSGPLTDAQLRATPLPVSGSISATNPSVGVNGVTLPLSSTLVAGSDGTLLRAIKTSTAGVVSVDGSGTTQPMSAVSLPLPTGASTSGLQTTGNTSVASIDTKTPALGQAAMAASVPVVIASNQSAVPVSGPLTDTQLRAATVPISGTVTATGPITDTQIRATPLPVSGTVTATGPLTDTQLRATPVPVSGTVIANAGSGTMATSLASLPALVAGSAIIGKVGIDQTTPGTTNLVSIGTNGTVAINTQLPTGTNSIGAVTNTNLDVALSTRLKPADTLAGVTTVAAVTAITNALPTGGNTIGAVTNANLDVALSTRLKPADTLAGVTTVTAVTAITNALPIGANKIGTVDIATAPATAKGVQGANGVPVQQLKDSGRNQTNFYMPIQIVSTATDALLALTGYKSGALVAATTTPAVVTAGKTYRITSITLTYVTIVTTPGAIRFTLRANTGGVVAIGSPVVANWTVGEPTGIAPVAGKFNTVTIPLPDGFEFAAGTGIGISQVGINTVGVAAVVGYGIVTINGYEY